MGLHVIVEKPVAITCEEVDRMVEAGERNGVVVMSGHSRRFNGPLRKTKEIIESGRIGGVLLGHVACGYDVAEVPVSWWADARVTGASNLLYNWGAHSLDEVYYLYGAPTRVYAEGTDTAFAQGVTAVDSARMQYVGTHPGMGKKRRQPDAPVFSLTDVPDVADSEPGRATCEASPEYASLVAAYKKSGGKGRLAARASYLLRDALKVVGCGALGLAPATGALFYVNADDPLSGGTGHTIRVCRLRGVKILFQDEWMQREGVGQR